MYDAFDAPTQWDRMIAGAPYDGASEEFFAARAACAARKAEVDAIPASDVPARAAALARLFGATDGPCIVQPPFEIEFGTNLRLGAWVFVNTGAVFNDCAPITIGERSMIGPRVMFLTASHPVLPEDRYVEAPDQMPPLRPITQAKPINVGRNVWIGGGAIILPGVTIGDDSVIGAGSVVTRSIPPRSVAAGNPARVIRSVDDPR